MSDTGDTAATQTAGVLGISSLALAVVLWSVWPCPSPVLNQLIKIALSVAPGLFLRMVVGPKHHQALTVMAGVIVAFIVYGLTPPGSMRSPACSPLVVQIERVQARRGFRDFVAREEVIAIPPHRALEFVGGEAHEWTHDQLDGIGQIVQDLPVVFPLDDRTHNRAEVINELRAIPTGTLAYDTTHKRQFGEYISRLKSRLHRGAAGSPLIISTDIKRDREPEVAKDFWEGVVARHLYPTYPLTGSQNKRWAFGPWYDAGGSEGGPPADRKVPSHRAAMAEVVAVHVMLDTLTHRFKTVDELGEAVPFGRFGDRVENNSDSTVFVRFLMNDDQPEDNSPVGYCDVRYREVPVNTPLATGRRQD